MIICGHSLVEAVGGGWRINIPPQVSSSLNLFPGQNIFGSAEAGSLRHFLSPIKLNPHVSYFRVFLEDIMGSLATTTRLFSEKGVNILNSAAFGFGNIWVSEYIADFSDVETSADAVASDLEALGGFVTSREITEYFPKAFSLEEECKLKEDENGLFIVLPEIPEELESTDISYAILKAWPEVQAIFLDHIAPGTKLLKITAMIDDVPGSLNKLTALLGSQVNLHAIHGQHHEADNGEWLIYGVLEVGQLSELVSKAEDEATIIKFRAERLGWKL